MAKQKLTNMIYWIDMIKLQKTISMARTTGYTCTAVANLILNGLFTRKGIIPTEYIGEDSDSYQYVMSYLKERNVIYNRSTYKSE